MSILDQQQEVLSGQFFWAAGMFLTLLMPPAHVGACTEILDLLKSKRNDLTNCYFPVYENCKVVRHVSD